MDNPDQGPAVEAATSSWGTQTTAQKDIKTSYVRGTGEGEIRNEGVVLVMIGGQGNHIDFVFIITLVWVTKT